MRVPTAESLTPLAIALLELGLAFGSVYLALTAWALPESERQAFLSSNGLSAALRARMLLTLFGVGAAPVLLAGLYWLRRGQAAFRPIVRAGQVCSPLMLSCFLPSLFDYDWHDKPLAYLAQLLGFALALERLLLRAFSPPHASPGQARAYSPTTTGVYTRASRVLPLAVVLLAGTAYAAYMSFYTIQRHHMLGTAGFDLGIFDNLMFNALHGNPFRSTVAVPNGSYLSNHAEYGMYLFVPIYALWPNAETLLVMQSTMIGLAAWPLYLFCSTQLSRWAAAALACAYLFFAPLHGPNFYDFHWMPMAMFFFHWLFYAIAKRKALWVGVLCAVICSMREDAAFGLIAAGLFLIATKYWVRAGAWLTLVSTLWFLLVKFVIMPWAGPWWFADIYKDLVAQGEHGYGSIVRTILINPNYFLKTLLTEPKLVYTLHMFAPLVFLPLRLPVLALLMLPGFFVTLMTTGYAPTVSITFQYTTTWIPFLFAAAAIAVRQRTFALGVPGRRSSILALCLGVLCHSYVFGAILQHETFVGGFSRVFFYMSPGEKQRYADLKAIAARIPPGASVAASELEIPHVSSRLDAYSLKITTNDAEYFLLNRQHLDPDARQRIKGSLREYPYGLVAKQGLFFLFKKNHESPETEAALRTLGLPTHR
jgi:uncharacterized membrane protein